MPLFRTLDTTGRALRPPPASSQLPLALSPKTVDLETHQIGVEIHRKRKHTAACLKPAAASDVEADKEVDEGNEVCDVERNGEELTRGSDTGGLLVGANTREDGLLDELERLGRSRRKKLGVRCGTVGCRGERAECRRDRVEHVPAGGGNGTCRVRARSVREPGVRCGKATSDDELGDLNGGHAALEAAGEGQLERGHRVVGVHERVHERVEQQEDEHRGGRVAVGSPHAQDRTGMVVRLQVAHGLALENEDDRVDNLVVLGDVEQPHVDAEASKRGIGDGHSAVGVRQTREASGKSTAEQVAQDARSRVEEGPTRVDGEQDVVAKHGLRQTVRLLDEVGGLGLARTKAVVGGVRGEEVDDTREQRHPGRERELKRPVGNRKALGLGRVWLLREPLPERRERVVEGVQHREAADGANREAKLNRWLAEQAHAQQRDLDWNAVVERCGRAGQKPFANGSSLLPRPSLPALGLHGCLGKKVATAQNSAYTLRPSQGCAVILSQKHDRLKPVDAPHRPRGHVGTARFATATSALKAWLVATPRIVAGWHARQGATHVANKSRFVCIAALTLLRWSETSGETGLARSLGLLLARSFTSRYFVHPPQASLLPLPLLCPFRTCHALAPGSRRRSDRIHRYTGLHRSQSYLAER
ncbi:hypothetical protein L1887_58470 [Cichorium endivia]|nr:hypothetical protein L1887_58470 [Cichorium endivia]